LIKSPAELERIGRLLARPAADLGQGSRLCGTSNGLSDPDAPNQTPISLDGLVLCHCESGADKAGQRAACKAVGEHDRFGSTERTAGEQLERSTLF
jgi:hypothetical protein